MQWRRIKTEKEGAAHFSTATPIQWIPLWLKIKHPRPFVIPLIMIEHLSLSTFHCFSLFTYSLLLLKGKLLKANNQVIPGLLNSSPGQSTTHLLSHLRHNFWMPARRQVCCFNELITLMSNKNGVTDVIECDVSLQNGEKACNAKNAPSFSNVYRHRRKSSRPTAPQIFLSIIALTWLCYNLSSYICGETTRFLETGILSHSCLYSQCLL